MEEMVRGSADVSGMIFGCLKEVVHLLAGIFGGAVFETGILIKAADKEKTVAHPA